MSRTVAPVEIEAFKVAHAESPILLRHLSGIMAGIATALKETFVVRDARLDALEARIKELEARPVTKDAGVWKANTVYAAGSLVSHSGSGWICSMTHLSTGAEPSRDHFRLFVKHGKDAR